MASTKDTFEAATFLANTFACGTFRGTGVTPAGPDMPGIEYATTDDRLHFRDYGSRMHYASADERLHYKAQEPT